MNSLRLLFTLAVLSMMSLATSTRAADLVDNPTYQSWASHKPGTTVHLQQQMNVGGMSMNHEITETLKEVTPDKATIEYAIVMDIGGQKHEQKNTQSIPAKIEKGQEQMPPNMKGTVKDAGSEKVEAGGKSYDCKVLEFTGESPHGKSSGKMWRSDDIPGDLVKMEMKIEGKMQGTITMTATSVEIK